MKISDDIKVFFSIEKVWKTIFENVWEPCVLYTLTKSTALQNWASI